MLPFLRSLLLVMMLRSRAMRFLDLDIIIMCPCIQRACIQRGGVALSDVYAMVGRLTDNGNRFSSKQEVATG